MAYVGKWQERIDVRGLLKKKGIIYWGFGTSCKRESNPDNVNDYFVRESAGVHSRRNS